MKHNFNEMKILSPLFSSNREHVTKKLSFYLERSEYFFLKMEMTIEKKNTPEK